MASGTRFTPSLRGLVPLLALAVVPLLFLLLNPAATLSLADIRLVLLQSSIVSIAALGAAMVIATGGIDLSVGSCVAIAGVAAAWALKPWADVPGGPGFLPPLLAILAALAAGSLAGITNGLLITLLRLPPFIATLGTLGFIRGVAKLFTSSGTIYARPGWLSSWVAAQPSPSWLLVAPSVWLTLLLAVLTGIFMSRTVIGRRALAIGDNQEAAMRCGVPVQATKFTIYLLAGLLAALAGVVQFARLNGAGDPTIQGGLELKAIAAVVIGGASLSGGNISIFGTICGAVLMSLLDNRCAAAGLPNYAQEMIVGPIIITAVAMDRSRRDR